MAVTIPKTQYIGHHKNNPKSDEMPLGFLTPGGTNAGAKKRKETVNNWLGIDNVIRNNVKLDNREQYEKDNPTAVMVRDSTDEEQECFQWLHYETSRTPGDHYTILDEVENEARFGFRITKSISRGGGWSGSNKLVRIEDPRGFELEISVDNLVKMMSMTTFVDGVCQEKCVWGREGSTNILLPVNSQPYNDAFDTTAYRAKQAISLRDVNFGDKVELKKTEHFSGLTGIYMGAYHVYAVAPLNESQACRDARSSRYGSSNADNDWTFIKTYKRYLIKVNVKGVDMYHGVSGCKIHKILEKVDTPLDRPDIDAGIFKDLTYSYNGYRPIFLSTKKIPVKEIAASAQWSHTDDMSLVNTKDSGPLWIWAYDKKLDSFMRFGRDYHSPHYHKSGVDETVEERKLIFVGSATHLDKENNTWAISGVRGAGGKGVLHLIKNPTDPAGLIITEYEWYQLSVNVNDHTWKLPIAETRGW